MANDVIEMLRTVQLWAWSGRPATKNVFSFKTYYFKR